MTISDSVKFYSSSMFRHAPFTKFWLLSLICCSIIRITQEIYQVSGRPYVQSFAEVSEGKILHLIYSPFMVNNVPELTISAILLYFFRKIERRFGTKKYINYLIISLATSQCIRYLLVKLVFYSSMAEERIPFGGTPLILLSCIYCQFILEVPVYPLYSMFELIPISEHHLILFLLAQTFSTFTVIHFAIPAILSTMIYRSNLFYIQKLSFIPEFVADSTRNPESFIGSWIAMFEETFETRKFKSLPVAATLERQRIEEEDEIQRQMLQQHLGRGGNARMMGFQQQQPAGPPPESLIQGLVGMGFANRQEVIRALQEANHNIEVAANLLLQRTFN